MKRLKQGIDRYAQIRLIHHILTSIIPSVSCFHSGPKMAAMTKFRFMSKFWVAAATIFLQPASTQLVPPALPVIHRVCGLDTKRFTVVLIATAQMLFHSVYLVLCTLILFRYISHPAGSLRIWPKRPSEPAILCTCQYYVAQSLSAG